MLGLLAGGVVWGQDIARWLQEAQQTTTRAEPAAAEDDKDSEPSPAVKALIETLKDKDAEVRKTAIQALGRIGKGAKAAVPALAETLKDDDVDVREAACGGAGTHWQRSGKCGAGPGGPAQGQGPGHPRRRGAGPGTHR